tara:strand:+ start:161 stop:430 length:270 start_codon:yes stop_codon:yes gene_type:complete
MKSFFKKLFVSDHDQRIKNLEIHVVRLLSQLRALEEFVGKQTEILAQLANVQSSVVSTLQAQEFEKEKNDKKAVSLHSLLIDSEDDFIN